MQIKNEAMLITYADSMGNNLKELNEVLDTHLQGVVGGVHLLPFYPLRATGDLPRWITPRLTQLLATGRKLNR